MYRRLVILLIAVALAGCFGSGQGKLSDEEARQRTQDALESFAASLDGGGDIKRMEGSFQGAGGDGFGAFDFDLLMEWGTGGTMHIKFTVKSGGSTTVVDMYCDETNTILVWGEDVYESRKASGQECMEELSGGEDVFDLSELPEELDNLTVIPHDDGSVTATVTDDEGTYTLKIDSKGRLVRMDIQSEEASGFFTVTYGARGPVSVPTATDRLPASISGLGSFDASSDMYRWSSGWDDGSYPMDEFEVRVMDGGDQVATFPLAGGHSQQSGGFAFTFTDDGDGHFGANDTFTIRSSAWTQSGQYDVVVWDTWADRDIEDNPMPGWGIGLGALGLLGVALYRRHT